MLEAADQIDQGEVMAGLRRIAEYERLSFRIAPGRPESEALFHRTRCLHAVAAEAMIGMSLAAQVSYLRRMAVAIVPQMRTEPSYRAMHEADCVVNAYARAALIAAGEQVVGAFDEAAWSRHEQAFCQIDARFVAQPQETLQ